MTLATHTRRQESEPLGDPSRGRLRPRASVVGAGLAIEGQVVGEGDLHVAGRLKGTVRVTGEVRIEPGAVLEGEVYAAGVKVAGELRGSVVAETYVELTESGQLIGNLKAASLTVAAGARMRGGVESGGSGGEPAQPPLPTAGR